MAEVTVYINGRSYDISCDSGQEGRLVDLASYIDSRLQQIARGGAAYNDAHLMVLTALVLADEVFDAKELAAGAQRAARMTQQPQVQAAPAPAVNKDEEMAVLRVLEHLTRRIEGVAGRIAQAS